VTLPFTVVIIKCLAENSTMLWTGSSFHAVFAAVPGAAWMVAVMLSSILLKVEL
jgi:hypothetical protein